MISFIIVSTTTEIVVLLQNAANSLNINVWLNLSSKLLSKTKQQNISVAASFKNVVVPAIIAANDSTLQTSDPDLSNLLSNSLMRNSVKAQIVDATWNFEELVISEATSRKRYILFSRKSLV